jgi:hypothetical protein
MKKSRNNADQSHDKKEKIKMSKKILVVIALIATIVVNVLSNSLPFNGITAPEIADLFDVYFIPAGYVFSIWGIIYLGLIAYALFQFLPSQRDNSRLNQIAWWFVLSSVANSVWLFLWHYGYFGLSNFAMLTLLVSLISIYLRLSDSRITASSGERWLVHLPFSIYLGWITVATIANVTAYLDFIDWDGLGIAPETWTFIMLFVAVAVAGMMAFSQKDIAYLLVLIWAFVGIAAEQSDTAQIANGSYIATAIVGIFVLLVIIQTVRQTRTPGLETS